MPADSSVVIVDVRPALLGTYGDGGNALVLCDRLRRRGYATELVRLDGRSVVPRASSVVLLGGGEDDAQRLVATDEPLRDSLLDAVDAGASVLAVCAGLQVLGTSFLDGAGRSVPGFGLFDCTSDRLPRRAVGEIVTDAAPPGIGRLTGFENHLGRTVLGPSATPLGRTVHGVGNGAGDGDGVIDGGVVGTYLHGPVLARNPALADWLLERVVGPLEPIDDDLVERLRAERLAASSLSPSSPPRSA
jgi:CobQ-like glutamine amidotransferase family enzyme